MPQPDPKKWENVGNGYDPIESEKEWHKYWYNEHLNHVANRDECIVNAATGGLYKKTGILTAQGIAAALGKEHIAHFFHKAGYVSFAVDFISFGSCYAKYPNIKY